MPLLKMQKYCVLISWKKRCHSADIKGHKNELILKQAKEVATTLLPLILKKNGNENYGRSMSP